MSDQFMQYTVWAKFLKEALGEKYDIALVSAEDLEHELMIENRTIVKQEFADGDCKRILLDILNSSALKKQDYLCSFAETEKRISSQKISVFCIHGDNGEPVGFLCIREKDEDRFTIGEVFAQMLEPYDLDAAEQSKTSARIGEEMNFCMRKYIEEIWNRYQMPDKKLKKSEKLAFMMELLEAGIFRMKGAAAEISAVTGISQASVYRYLSEILPE